MLGIDLEKEGVRTVLDVLFDIQKKQGYEELGSMPMPEKIEYLFSSECLYESKHFDLVSLGVKWTEGCYCAPNNLVGGIIPREFAALGIGLDSIRRRRPWGCRRAYGRCCQWFSPWGVRP